jgi:hypothetical protein
MIFIFILQHFVSKRWEVLFDEDKQSFFSALPKLIGGVVAIN